MTPDFALSLSFDGIRLFYRMAEGWGIVGEVALDDPALGKALAGLRAQAKELSPDGFNTKLIIPNEQIKYLTLETGEVDGAARWVTARAALDGATPYQVDELAFDLAALGYETQVAAVAYETLNEAENFAVTHGFAPVSFVAIPEASAFSGEPFFGETALFKGEHGPGATVFRDSTPIVVVGPAVRQSTPPEPTISETLEEPNGDAPETQADVALEVENMSSDALAEAVLGAPKEAVKFEFRETDETAADETSTEIAEEIALTGYAGDAILEAPGAPGDSATTIADEALLEGLEDDAPLVFHKEESSVEDDVESFEEQETHEVDASAQDVHEVTDPPSDVEELATPVAADADEIAPDEPATEDSTIPVEEPADAPDPEAEIVTEPVGAFQSTRRNLEPEDNQLDIDATAYEPQPDTADDAVAADDQAVEAHLETTDAKEPLIEQEIDPIPVFRRAHQGEEVRPEPTPSETEDDGASVGFASRRGSGSHSGVPKLGGVTRPGQPNGPSISITAPSIPVDGDTPDPPPAREATHHGLAASLVLQSGAPSEAEPGESAGAPPMAGAAAVSLDEADRLTVFGARQSNTGGKPRFLGLLLTAILIIFLAGVAAWAAVFMDDGLAGLFKTRAEPELAAAPIPAVDIPAPQSVAPESPPETTLASLAPDAPEPETPVAARPDPEPAPTENEIVAANEASLGVVWTRAPSNPLPAALVPIDDVFAPGIGSANEALGTPERSTPPRLASLQADDVILTPSTPAPPGIRFELDARGLVVARPEGAMNPDGILVFTGRPPVVPPERPEPPVIEPDTAESLDPEIAALAAFRPRPRPEDLKVILPETETDAETAGADASEDENAELPDPETAIGRDTEAQVIAALAAYRPVLRPKVERTQEEERAEEETAAPTAQAVQVSFRPASRPRNFARIVARATPTPEVEEQPATRTPVRTIAPKAVTPKVPSTASVSREATVRNAINLSRINLIGVYGKPSERRALVRLSNGRYQKVKVGDRLDGGQVSAIGDGELRYQKRGRNVVLRMPKG